MRGDASTGSARLRQALARLISRAREAHGTPPASRPAPESEWEREVERELREIRRRVKRIELLLSASVVTLLADVARKWLGL